LHLTQTFLVFGDLHGRVLPAFRLAAAWSREQGVPLAGLLQVGDLGYFPDHSRLDKATRRHAARDPDELGVALVTAASREADEVFDDPDVPDTMWCTLGNHEDYDAVAQCDIGGGDEFALDAYGRVRCIRDGHVAELPGGLRVGAIWGIDDKSPNARRRTPQAGRIRPRSTLELSGRAFDVLLTHESPRDAILIDSGSDDLTDLVAAARPAFVFFGHYHARIGRVDGDFGPTQVYLMSGLEFRGRDRSAEAGSVGVLTWRDGVGEFEYVDETWLAGCRR